MTVKIKDVVSYLDSEMHPEYQEEYDNSGFLVGNGEAEYRGVLVALDATPAVVEEARRLGLNLIVTHHPMIFAGLKRITDGSESGRMIMSLIENGISVYAAHTNLDNLPWGVNRGLADRIGLRDCRILHADKGDEIGAGMIGELAEAEDAEAFVKRVKEAVGIPTVRCCNMQRGKMVRRVAICGGAGAFLTGDAMRAGADIYITADLKYHDFQRTDGRMILADIGHYESEQFAKEIILRCILKKFSTFASRISKAQQGIVEYI